MDREQAQRPFASTEPLKELKSFQDTLETTTIHTFISPKNKQPNFYTTAVGAESNGARPTPSLFNP